MFSRVERISSESVKIQILLETYDDGLWRVEYKVSSFQDFRIWHEKSGPLKKLVRDKLSIHSFFREYAHYIPEWHILILIRETEVDDG